MGPRSAVAAVALAVIIALVAGGGDERDVTPEVASAPAGEQAAVTEVLTGGAIAVVLPDYPVTLWIDGREVTLPPGGARLRYKADGVHEIAAAAPGREPFRQRVEVAGGGETRIEGRARADPASRRPIPPESQEAEGQKTACQDQTAHPAKAARRSRPRRAHRRPLSAMRALTILALLGARASAAPAHADDKARARALHERGLRHYKVGEHAAAIRYYKDAYKAYPAPGILFNLAQAYRQNGDCEQALATYRNYVAEVPDGPNADTAREHIGSLRCATEVKPQPEPEPEQAVEPAPAAAISAKPAEQRDKGKTARVVGYVFAGISVAALGGSIAFGLKSRSTSAEIEEFFAAGGTWNEELAAIEERGENEEKRALIFGASPEPPRSPRSCSTGPAKRSPSAIARRFWSRRSTAGSDRRQRDVLARR